MVEVRGRDKTAVNRKWSRWGELTEFEEEGGHAAAHPGQDAARPRACVPQHGGVQFRGVDIHQGGAGGDGKLSQHLQSHSQGGEAW